jgi:ABC-type multidrug transport system ATPase subunit
LIPPIKIHPWLSWIHWINLVQNGFEALLSSEFYSLEIECVAPMLVPQGPNVSSQYQSCTVSCTVQGSQPGSTTDKYEYVERIIDLLEMGDVGGAAVRRIGGGLNREQRKRVTIGVEPACKPALLFFVDEPTSGLDSQATYNIVRFLRKLADAGQAIPCAIHQPSAVLFKDLTSFCY